MVDVVSGADVSAADAGAGRRSSIADMRAAMVPKCCCNSRITKVRVSGAALEDDPDTTDEDGSLCEVVLGRDGDGTADEIGGGAELDGAVDELDMGSVVATDTRLSQLGVLRRL